ncbi:NUDIX domain-containing protein [Patescibacteria group bacterium]|nr:NUDIX domain-containing protein [Patescibacteria group bacterium]
MRHRISCGVIPIHVSENGTIRFLLVQGHGDYWGFPKGHKKGNETHKETAERELLEETGVVCSEFLGNTIFTERYRISKKKGSDIIKKVLYFVGLASHAEVTIQTTELKKYGWFTLEEAEKKLLNNRADMLREVSKLLPKDI